MQDETVRKFPTPQQDPYTLAQPMAPAGKAQEDLDVTQLFRVIWVGRWLILACILIAGLLGGYYAFVVATPSYLANTRLALQVRSQQVVDLESVISGVSTEAAAINTELEVIRSRGLIARLVDDMDLTADPEFNTALQEPSPWSVDALTERVGLTETAGPVDPETARLRTINTVRQAISVTSKKATYLFDISVTTNGALKSAMIANRLAELYIDDQVRIKFAATEYAISWLTERVGELESELKAKEDQIKELRSETELVDASALEALNIRSKELRERIDIAQSTLLQDRQNLAELEAIDPADTDEVLAVTGDPALRRLANDARNGDTEALEVFNARFQSVLSTEREAVERSAAQIAALESNMERLQEQIENQRVDLARLNQLVREADATRVLYETFLARLKETTIQSGLQQPDARVLSEATPGTMVAPRKMRITAVSMILGLLLGLAIVLVRQFMHDTFRTADDLEQRSGLPVLGQVPKMPIRQRAELLDYLRNNPTSATVEAIRNLRTSLLLTNIDTPPQVIMVTSSIPGEGKTTQSISLAQNLAGLGGKVLLIECDIRRRTFSKYFEANAKGGIVSVISGDLALSEAVLHDVFENCDVLMGDNAKISAADLLSSERFRHFIEFVRKQYDYVVIDTPPVLVVPDARIVGQQADAVLFSVRWDSTPKAQVLNGLRELQSVGVKINGVILSNVDPRGMRRYGYDGQYGAYSRYGKTYYDA